MIEDSGCRSRSRTPVVIDKTVYAGTMDREKRMMDVRSGFGVAIAPDSPANRRPRRTAEVRTAALIKRESTRREHAGRRGVSGAWVRGGSGVIGASGGDGGADGGEALAPSRSRARRAGTSRLGCRLAAESATRSDDTPW
eukprot:5652459-Pleurochrysis_carterae.AAC.1